MSEKTDNYFNLLTPYGLTREEAQVYLFLLKNGFSSVLTISRKTKISRTKVYRILDKVIEKQLVEQKLDDRGWKFGATTPEKFKDLVKQKQHQAEILKEGLPDLLEQLKLISAATSQESKVLYYHGIDGLKQITYNSLKAKNLLRIFEIYKMTRFIKKSEAEKLRKEFGQRKITVKQLSNVESFPGWTDVEQFVTQFWQCRYINPKELTIPVEALVYNNVYAIYTYKGGKIFGVEFYNQKLADMQKQIFDFIWQRAKKMKIIDKHGAAKVAKQNN